jgi:hypothetical protein
MLSIAFLNNHVGFGFDHKRLYIHRCRLPRPRERILSFVSSWISSPPSASCGLLSFSDCRRDDFELREKLAIRLCDSLCAPLLVPLSRVPVPAFYPFMQRIVRDEKPLPSKARAELRIWKEHPDRLVPVFVPVHSEATLQLNHQKFSARGSHYQVFAVAICFRTIDAIASPNQECGSLCTIGRLDFVRR